MRETSIILLAVLAIAPFATAQDPDPTVNDSDYNTTTPSGDEQYLNDTAAEYSMSDNSSADPTVTDADFDMTTPTGDESYLDDSADPGAAGSASTSATPGLEVVALLGAVALAVAGLRRR